MSSYWDGTAWRVLPPGPAGPSGPVGPTGAKGATGAVGSTGAAGAGGSGDLVFGFPNPATVLTVANGRQVMYFDSFVNDGVVTIQGSGVLVGMR